MRTHPRERFFADVTLSPSAVVEFANAAGDNNPIHHDAEFAARRASQTHSERPTHDRVAARVDCLALLEDRGDAGPGILGAIPPPDLCRRNDSARVAGDRSRRTRNSKATSSSCAAASRARTARLRSARGSSAADGSTVDGNAQGNACTQPGRVRREPFRLAARARRKSASGGYGCWQVRRNREVGPPRLHINGPVLLIRAEEQRVLFGFWRGKRLQDIEPRLKPSGKYEMATLELREGMSVSAAIVRRLTKQAIKLNKSLGDPRDAAKPGKR